MKMNKKEFKVEKNIEGLRLDKALTLLDSRNSRVYFANLIKNSSILVNNQYVSPSYKVKENDIISIEYIEKESNTDLLPYEYQLDIVYEDDYLLVRHFSKCFNICKKRVIYC